MIPIQTCTDPLGYEDNIYCLFSLTFLLHLLYDEPVTDALTPGLPLYYLIYVMVSNALPFSNPEDENNSDLF